MIGLDQTPRRIETTEITETIEGTEAPKGAARGRPPVHLAPRNPPRQNNRDEGGAESEYREAGVPDRFPCFARRLLSVRLPYKFKPSNPSKYDGKTEPNQCLCIYSQSIELAGGDDNIKTLFFPMALEEIPLQWFDKLSPGSITCWDDLQKAFCSNFEGILTHPATRVELDVLRRKTKASRNTIDTLKNFALRFTISPNEKSSMIFPWG
jgi:hypothetical protein